VATADTAKLIASLELKDMFSGPAGKITKSLGNLDRGITNTQGRAYKAGQQIGTGIRNGAIIAAGGIAFLGSQVLVGLKELATLEKATAQTNAVLKSTKGAAGQTAESIRNLAEKYEGLNATIDDKVIQSGENLLLTFTKIRKDAFEPALTAALNLNTRLGGGEGGLQNAIKLVGKALNDPIKGLGALSKAGITFTKVQVDQIKAFIKNNDLMSAQALILGELGKRYGGAFAAEGGTAAAAVKGIGDAVEDLQKGLASGLFPVVQKFLPKIREALASPAFLDGVKKLGDGIASLFSDKNIAAGADILKGAFQTAKDVAPFVAAAAKTTFSFVQAAVSLFKSLPPQLQTLLVTGFAVNKLTGGLVTNIAGGLISSVLKQLVSGVVNVNGAVVNVVGAGVPGAVPGVVGGTSRLAQAASLVQKVLIVGMVAEVADLIHGAISPGGGIEGRTATGQLLPADQLQWPFGPKNTPTFDLGPFKNILGGTPAPTPNEGAAGAGAVGAATTALVAATKALTGGDRRQKDDIVNLVQLQKSANAYLSDIFQQGVRGLKTATKPKDIAKAVKDALSLIVDQRRGNALATERVLADLKKQLAHTHDAKTAAILRDAIGKVEHKLAGRQLVQKQLDKADKIFKSNESTKDKIRDLTAVEKSLAGKSASAQAKVAARIEQVRKAAKYAGQQAAAAIKDKDLSVTVPIKNYVTVSLREFANSTKTYRRIGNATVSTSFGIGGR
jgi:hypothetical protein